MTDAPNWMTYANSARRTRSSIFRRSSRTPPRRRRHEWVAEQDQSNEWFVKVWKSQVDYAGLWSQAHRYR